MENQHQESVFNSGHQTALPNATAVLVLGIISIPACCFYGIGVVFGIIALVMASKDRAKYTASPELYTESSYKNLNTGRICAIIGTILSVLYVIILVVFLVIFGTEALSNPNFLKERYMH